MKKQQQKDSVPSISYLQTEDYSSYPSSYDSRADISDQTKQTIEQSTNIENNPRHSISSQITLIDEQDNSLYNNHVSPIVNNDETILSVTSTSPTEQSTIMSIHDYPIRSKISYPIKLTNDNLLDSILINLYSSLKFFFPFFLFDHPSILNYKS